MKCPKCGGKTQTADSRPGGIGRRRRRKCRSAACGHEFATIEGVAPEEGKHFHGELTLAGRCQFCGETASLASIYPAADGASVQRIYHCARCSTGGKAAETHTVESPGVGVRDALALYGTVLVKRSGKRVPYDRNTLAAGLSAIRNSALDENLFREAVRDVDARARGRAEVLAQEIEDWLLDFFEQRSPFIHLRLLIDFGRVTDIGEVRKRLANEDGE